MKAVIFWVVFFVCIVTQSCKKETNTSCVCPEVYNPVCAGDNQYRNPCEAHCKGFYDDAITILLTQEEIDSGLLISVDCSQ